MSYKSGTLLRPLYQAKATLTLSTLVRVGAIKAANKIPQKTRNHCHHSLAFLFALLHFALHANTMSAASFPCLTDAQAHGIIEDQIIEIDQPPGYVKVVKRLHTRDFIGISDSVNLVTGVPVLLALSPNLRSYKLMYMQAQHNDNAFTQGAITAEQRATSYRRHQDVVSESYLRHDHLVLRAWHNAFAYSRYYHLLRPCGS